VPAPTLLHICGRSTRHLPHIATTGASAYNFDEGVDPAEARRHLDGTVALTGYVPTVSVMLNGTPDDVRRSAWECLDNGVHLLTPGCALAPYTPLANLRALAQAAQEYASAHPHTPEAA
jgi:[methyl-Co(III) methanol-specific corrinoid protein]:coenzyme M methyltransferase